MTAAAAPPVARRPKSRTRVALWAAGAVLSALIALVSYRYLLHVGPTPDVIGGNRYLHPWLAVHVACAATALLVVPVQLLESVRARMRALHRWLGRVYATACIGGGAAGLVLALGASTGAVSSAGFGLLAALWIVTTSFAWTRARQRDFAAHREWMLRSFALTFAAVTLRLYLPIAALLPVAFDDSYRAISFLCWVPNLLVAEAYLRGTHPSRR